MICIYYIIELLTSQQLSLKKVIMLLHKEVRCMEINEIIQVLKENKYRLTDQRKVFLEVLTNNQQTLMTADELTTLCQKKNANINSTTIYRNIEMLDSLNLLYTLNVDRYTAAYKLICNSHHHHHIICSNCGEMVSLDYCPISNELINLIHEKGYDLKSHNLDLYGICSKCKNSLN